jgi:hypothetical protein
MFLSIIFGGKLVFFIQTITNNYWNILARFNFFIIFTQIYETYFKKNRVRILWKLQLLRRKFFILLE